MLPVLLALAFLAPAWAAPQGSAEVVLNETGSTLLYPLFKLWTEAYAAVEPSVTIKPVASNSGEGINLAIAGTVQIGASDAYMSDQMAQQNRQIANVPLAISAQMVSYNIPELKGVALRLDGPHAGGDLFRHDPAVGCGADWGDESGRGAAAS